MENLHPLVQFKVSAANHLPGLLAVFDMADAKRRNCHLGHLVVDRDIQEFDQMLQASVAGRGVARRVRGTSWLAIYPQVSAKFLDELLLNFHSQNEMQIGWRVEGRKDGVEKAVERTIQSTISRALRCVYANATSKEELEHLSDELLEQCYGLPLNSAIKLEELANYERRFWTCVSNYPAEKPFCPFCESSEFDLEDGDGSVYSGSGTCKNCRCDMMICGIQ